MSNFQHLKCTHSRGFHSSNSPFVHTSTVSQPVWNLGSTLSRFSHKRQFSLSAVAIQSSGIGQETILESPPKYFSKHQFKKHVEALAARYISPAQVFKCSLQQFFFFFPSFEEAEGVSEQQWSATALVSVISCWNVVRKIAERLSVSVLPFLITAAFLCS